jgi:hypothetical protein
MAPRGEEATQSQPQSRREKILNTVLGKLESLAGGGQETFSTAEIANFKEQMDALKRDAAVLATSMTSAASTKKELKTAKKEVEQHKRELEALKKVTPFLRFFKFEEVVEPGVMYVLTGLPSAQALRKLYELVDAYAQLKGTSADNLNLYRGPHTTDPSPGSVGGSPRALLYSVRDSNGNSP